MGKKREQNSSKRKLIKGKSTSVFKFRKRIRDNLAQNDITAKDSNSTVEITKKNSINNNTQNYKKTNLSINNIYSSNIEKNVLNKNLIIQI